MLSEADVLAWRSKFAKPLPFRKLQKLILSLPVNIWFDQLLAHGLLPRGCHSIHDLYLYDVHEHWKQIHRDWALKTSSHGLFTSFSYARLQPLLSMFEKQSSSFAKGIGQQERLSSVWHRYGAMLEQGFGLQSTGDLPFL